MSGALKGFPYIWYWDRQGRKGQACKVLARAKLATLCEWATAGAVTGWSFNLPQKPKKKDLRNSRLLEFEDGYRMVTSGSAIRKARIPNAGPTRNPPSTPRPHHRRPNDGSDEP